MTGSTIALDALTLCYRAYEAGNTLAVPLAIRVCHEEGKPLPAWLTAATLALCNEAIEPSKKSAGRHARAQKQLNEYLTHINRARALVAATSPSVGPVQSVAVTAERIGQRGQLIENSVRRVARVSDSAVKKSVARARDLLGERRIVDYIGPWMHPLECAAVRLALLKSRE